MLLATGDRKESQASSLWTQHRCHHFEFYEIQLATENFDESLVIGRGGFGKVYKGTIINGSSLVVAAIKRLDHMSNQGAAEFWAEVEMLSNLRHSHLVSLIGYCNHEKEMILVYEYMPYGTLEDHLHKLHTPLSWLHRLKLCIGAARGLDYLHTGTGIEHGVIHRDVKSSNILLYNNWASKISDFGLSRVGPKDQSRTYINTVVKGTFGYLDPDYFRTGRLTRKSDVYAFGVVLFEVLCRKRAVDRSIDEEQWGLARWAQDSIKEGSLKHIIDTDMRDQISPKCLKEFARIADRCLHDSPKERPTMAEVVFTLECVLTLQEKANNSLQHAGKTIFGRLVDMLPFPSKESKGEHSAHGDSRLPSNSKSDGRSGRKTLGPDNMFMDTREDPADCRIPSPSLQVFKFVDLKAATNDFNLDRLLRDEGRGKVFLGWVDKNTFAPSSLAVGMAVAVITCSHENAEWLAELTLLGRLAHPNVISLLGYCNDEQGNLLVYEYMQNRSFDRFLFSNASIIAEPLSWRTRLNIMMGVARGLSYLHSSKVQVIHHRLRSSSIFLDQDFNAKLGDFGVARSGAGIGKTTHALGSVVYLDPEYLMTGHLTAKSDIYSFGVVLLETLTGQQAIDEKRPVEQQNLVTWICLLAEKGELKKAELEKIIGCQQAIDEKLPAEQQNLATWISLLAEVGELKKRELEKIMDPRLQQNYPIEGTFECVQLAVRCVALNLKDRPSIEEVLQSLEAISAVTNN